MKLIIALLSASVSFSASALGGQVPLPANAPDIAITSNDRVYTADQTSNTVSVFDPASEKLLGVIPLGLPIPQTLSPLYRGQLLVHGLGFAPDHKTLAVVSVGSNSVTFIDTATNAVKHTAYVGRSPHEAFYTPDGKEVWVTIRGEDFVSVLDAASYRELRRITVGDGPGMTMFGPDGKYAFICSSFHPELKVVDVATSKIVATVQQASPFCPDIAVTPDNAQVWFTLKDIGKTQVISAKPPFTEIALLDTGPITNHVNIVRNAKGQFAFLTVGGENAVKVYTTDAEPKLVATINTPDFPHGIWPSGDGTRIYAALENGSGTIAIDTLTNKIAAVMPGGQSPQALAYVPNAVPAGAGTDNLKPLEAGMQVVHLVLGKPGASEAATTVAVNSQGLLDLVEAAVAGLQPKTKYQMALAENASAPFGKITPIVNFETNPAGAAIVTVFAPTKTVAEASQSENDGRTLVIRPINEAGPGEPIQVQRKRN